MEFKSNLENNSSSEDNKCSLVQNKKQIYILLSSEFQPIHNGHIRMLEAAKKYIEKKNEIENIKCEIQGLLIPQNKSQLFFQYLDDDIRLRLINITIKNSTWLTLDESLVHKKFKSIKEVQSNYCHKYPTAEIYEVINIDRFPAIIKQINDFITRNIIFVECRFAFEDEVLEDIKEKIKDISNLQFISDLNDDLDTSSRIVRDTYSGGFDISQYVKNEVAKFHKSQNIKYKLNPNIKNKDLLLKKGAKSDKKEVKKDQKENQKEVKSLKKDDKSQINHNPKQTNINLKHFINFDYNTINSKDLNGFPNDEIKNQTKVKVNDEEKKDDQSDIKDDEEQPIRDKNYLGRGLQAKVLSMDYSHNEKDINKLTQVAVKMVKFNSQVSRKQATFYRELRALQSCNGHKNVVFCYGAGNQKDIGYMVLERCAKKRFKKFILEFKPEELFMSKYFMQLLTDLCDGCDHMAKKGVLHRDLQINNILMKLKSDDQDLEDIKIEDILELKLSDFGVSAINEDKENIVKGSTRHYSPEAVEDKVNYTDKSDVYSFGALIYEIFYKHWVFPNCTVQECCEKTKQGLLTPLDDTLPLKLQQIILNSWKFNPIERISFYELKQQLQEYTNSLNNTN